MKKLLSILVMLAMLTGACGALAAPGDAAPIRRDVDGYDINSAAVIGDTIYVANWNSMLRYRLGDAKPVELDYQRPESGDIRTLITDGDKLYALVEEWGGEGEDTKVRLTELTIDGDKVAFGDSVALDWSEMIMRDGEYTHTREYDNPVIIDGKLYLITVDDRWENTSLVSFSLADGSFAPAAEDAKLTGIAPYKDGQLLVLTYETDMWSGPCAVATLDPASGALTKAFEISDISAREVFGLAYDAASDTTYYVTGGQIHGVKALNPSTDQAVNDMPLQNNGMLARYGRMIGGFYMFYNYETMLIRNVNPDERPTRMLTIRGYLEPDNAYYAFSAAHPDVAVVMDNNYSNGEEVTKAMMNREDKVDIYLLTTNSSEYRALTGRGYVAELTDEAIREQVSLMYPAVREALSPGGKLAAVPQSLYGSEALSYSKPTMEKLKLTEDDLPKTWIQMIDFLERWGENYGEDFPEITPLDPSNMPNIRRWLLSSIFTSYVTTMEASGEQRFDSPVLRETLKRLDEADFSSIQTEESEDGYSWSSDTVLFSTWGQVGFSDWRNTDEIFWPISFAEGEPPYIPLTLQVCVVNPFSKNQDIAQEYLKTCLENMKRPMRITLCPDENEPVRETYYESNMRDMRKYLDEMQKQYEDAPPEEKQVYEGYVKEYQGYIEDYEKNAWAASAEDIARFREMAQHLIVPTFSGLGDQNSEEMRTLVERYVDRQIPMEQFISNMDQKLRMMTMEGY